MGDLIASFLGLPLVLFGRLLYFVSADLFYLSMISLTLLVLFITFVGLKVIPIERFAQLLLPRILGFMIALFWVKTKMMNLVLVGLIYNFLHKMVLQYFLSKDFINYWLKDFLGLNFFWEKFLLLFSVAFTAGIGTNICYNFLKIFSLVL
jgi:hypothetical protein